MANSQRTIVNSQREGKSRSRFGASVRDQVGTWLGVRLEVRVGNRLTRGNTCFLVCQQTQCTHSCIQYLPAVPGAWWARVWYLVHHNTRIQLPESVRSHKFVHSLNGAGGCLIQGSLLAQQWCWLLIQGCAIGTTMLLTLELCIRDWWIIYWSL